ncbi:MAG: carbon storage regulator CsrA [Planctomycetaceae bacterium]|nr:carbon storage regulator CsrA [Planctomycetaceae bacterium]
MLILSRKLGESIQISDNISVTVTEVKGGRVRLSIQAPRDVRVLRQEVLDRLAEFSQIEEDLPSNCADKQTVADPVCH